MNDLQLLKNLVSIYSPSGNEQKASEFLVSEMKKLGFEAEVDAVGNAIGKIGKGKTKLLLLGHIDTVKGEIKVEEKDGKLYGRGTVDAKGSLCAFTIAASHFKGSKNLQIYVVGAVEEEGLASKGARHLLETLSKPDFVVVGEPSSFQGITIGYKGRVLVDYSIAVKHFHSSRAERNALMKAVDFWNAVENHCVSLNKGKKMFDSTLPSLRKFLHTTRSLNDVVKLEIGLRTPLDFDFEKFKDFVDTIKADAEVSYRGTEKPVLAEKNTTLVKAFLSAIRSQSGNPTFKLKSGTCDMNVVAAVWKEPILAYGPGDSNLDHTPNEHIDISEYRKAIQVLINALSSLN